MNEKTTTGLSDAESATDDFLSPEENARFDERVKLALQRRGWLVGEESNDMDGTEERKRQHLEDALRIWNLEHAMIGEHAW